MDRRELLKRVGVGAAAVAGSGLLAACGSAGSAPAASAPAGAGSPGTATAAPTARASATPVVLRPIRISNTPDNQSPTDFMTLVPKSLGLYSKYGVDAQITDGTTASVPPLFLSGGLDVLLHGSALYSQALQGQNVRIVLGLGSASPFSLVVRSSIKSMADLKGKTIGNQALTGSIYELSVFLLQKAGLTAKDVQLVAIAGQPQLLQALIAGRIDAAMLPWQQAFAAKSEPSLAVLNEDPTAGGFKLKGYRFAGVQAAWAEKNPDAVTGFVTAVIEATRMLASDESLYRAQAKALFPTMDPNLVADMYRIKKNVGYWSVNGGVEPDALNGNLEFYRQSLLATGASAAPAPGLVDLKYAKAALDKLGGPIASKTDPGSWYKK